MIDKKSFINRFELEDKNILSQIYDKINMANRTNRIIYTNDFYTPNVWRNIQNMIRDLPVNVTTYGVFHESERRILIFSKEEVWEYPLSIMKVTNTSQFNILSHKDYLGAIMALGIKRDKFGDLIVHGNSCYVPMNKEMFDYIESNLLFIGKSPCKVESLDVYSNEFPQYKFEELILNVTALRVDCLVGAICGVSRSKSVDMIKKGKINIDYIVCSEKDRVIDENTIVTVKGFGKYKYIKKVGATNSGRLKVFVKKFI